MASGDVSKPYISAVQRSIELNFRSLSHASLRLSRALAVSERVMHRRLWKLTGQRQLLRTHDWQTRAELQTHLGALAVIQRQRGGGRVFSKDKHEFYDHDTLHSTAAAAAAAAAAEAAQQQEGRRAGLADAEAQDAEAGDRGQAATAAEGGAEKGEIGSAANHGGIGSEEMEMQAAGEQQQDECESEQPQPQSQPQLVSLCGESLDFSGLLSSRLRRQRAGPLYSRPATAAQAFDASAAQHERERERPLLLSASTRPHVDVGRPATSPSLSYSSRPLSLEQQAAELMSSIHSRHAEAQRELLYAGGGSVSRQQAAAAAAQNLFAGVKDRWHNTFTELERDKEDEQQERRRTQARQQPRAATEQARAGKQRQSAGRSAEKAEGKAAVSASRPSTSPATHRPTLPAAYGLRPATAGGASALLLCAPSAHSSLPASFPLPLSLSTFTQLAPIVRVPRDRNSGAGLESAAPSPPITAPATAEAPLLEPGSLSLSQQREEGGGGRESAAAAAEAVAAVSECSVYAQQRDAVLRSNFVRFLCTTEPQMWGHTGAAVAARSKQSTSSRQRTLS